MARSSSQKANTPTTLSVAESAVREELGFHEIERIEIEGDECSLVKSGNRPTILIYSPTGVIRSGSPAVLMKTEKLRPGANHWRNGM